MGEPDTSTAASGVHRLFHGWNLVWSVLGILVLAGLGFLLALTVSVVWYAFTCTEGGCGDLIMILLITGPITVLAAVVAAALVAVLVVRTPGTRGVTFAAAAAVLAIATMLSGLYWTWSWMSA